MGLGTNLVDWVDKHRKKPSAVIGNIDIPAYCLKKIGSRHLVLAGGGGSSKTGVANEIQTHLLSFEKENSAAPSTMRAECVDKFDTGPFATMNMDVACLTENPIDGRFLIAAGHEQFCDFYITQGFKLTEEDRKIGFNFKQIGRVRTDHHTKMSYQKCVKFDRQYRGQMVATGGADGHVRIWDARTINRKSEKDPEPKPLHDVAAHESDVDDIDFSYDSKILISVGNGKAFLWSTQTGEMLIDVPFPIEIARGFKMRSVRCTNLGAASSNTVFVAAYNSISRASKDIACYLALWAFNSEKKLLRPVIVKKVATEAISALSVTDCGNFTAIGTMSGGVGVYDTHDFRQLLFAPETHGIFVTSIEFLDKTASDVVLKDERGKDVIEPGPAAGSQASLVSLSADNSVQVHTVQYPQKSSISGFLLKLSIFSLFIYLLFFLFA